LNSIFLLSLVQIGRLNEVITEVTTSHARLESTLDYLKSQQQEFESLLQPLEASLPSVTHVEPEREHLYDLKYPRFSPENEYCVIQLDLIMVFRYTLAENMDTQLQQMSEDLKEVIHHINDSNKTVDKADPVSYDIFSRNANF